MPVFRVEKNSNYTTMCNYHLRDQNLSLKAKGLLSMCLSLSDSWDYSINGLVVISKEGRDAILSTVRELEISGYIVRGRTRDEQGRLRGASYTIYEMPQPPMTDNPTQEIPTQEMPVQEDPMQEKRKRLRKHTYKEKEIPRNLTPRDFVCIAEGMDSMAEVFSILLHSVFFPASHLTDISCTRRESGY